MKERDSQIDELYGLRMDINKKINLLEDKNSLVEALQKRLTCETERAQKIIAQEREVGQLKSDIQSYMQILKQVVKHMKTLLKYLHDQVQTTKDPTVIEQTNRQIRSIEKLNNEVKHSMKTQIKRAPKDCQDAFFSMSASDVCDNQDHSITAAVQERQSISKRRQQQLRGGATEKLALMSRESMHGANTIMTNVGGLTAVAHSPANNQKSGSGFSVQPMALKRAKLAVATEAGKNILVNISHDEEEEEVDQVSASAASAFTNQHMKTMVQTTDAEADEHQNIMMKQIVARAKATKSGKSNENTGIAAKRTSKSMSKSKGKVLETNITA